MMRMLWLVSFAVLCASPAMAQSDHLFGIGAGVSAISRNGGALTASPNWVAFRLPRPDRWGLAWDIGSDSNDVPASATATGIAGTLSGWHFLFGPGYTYRLKPVELTGSLMAGPITNTFHPATAATSTLTSKTSLGGLLQLTSWVDLNGRFGIKVSGDYLVTRPQLIPADMGTMTRWETRRLRVQAALVVGFY